jgi:TolA-binding protein
MTWARCRRRLPGCLKTQLRFPWRKCPKSGARWIGSCTLRYNWRRSGCCRFPSERILRLTATFRKQLPADFWRGMYQLTEQLQRLEEQIAQASEGQRENTDLVAAVRIELRQLRTVQVDEQGQIQAAQQRLADLQQTVDDLATRLETTISQRVEAVNEQVAEHQRRSSQAQQELRSTLTARIDQALSQPRALPPDQLQKVRDEVVERLLTEMATYGYTPPADSAGGATAPRVEPLADQPNPIWAEEVFGRGCTAYFGSRFDQSVGYFSQAVRNDPRNPVYHYFLGLSLYQSGRMEEATARVKAARRLELSNGSRQVNSALHRVQGPARIWLEEVRLSS